MYDRPTSRKMIMPGKRSISNRVQYHDIISNLDLILSTLDKMGIYLNNLEYLWIFLISSYQSYQLALS